MSHGVLKLKCVFPGSAVGRERSSCHIYLRLAFTHRDLAKKRSIGMAPTGGALTEGRSVAAWSQVASYQASIRLLAHERDYFGKGHICSGALVAPSVVLTVSSCLYSHTRRKHYHPAELRVILGNPQRFAPNDQGLTMGVTHVHQPPKDLALAILMLERDIPVDHPQVQPVLLPHPEQPSSSLSETSLQISTWGYDGHSRELHDLLTLNATQMSCQQSRAQPQPQPQRICVQAETMTSFGGQLFMDAGATLTDRNQLLGLCSADGGGFVDVASHVEWILTQIGDGSNQNSSFWGVLLVLAFTVYVLTVSRKSLLA
ncbi:uncharacterized protein LOC108164466 isoform X1 [Drosophila miranda]|uniref:uncharacterized protein LOC108164466 isoform X1 n=1 Tax=Drosophila miranda TaxID=7229 RepID=UPI00143F2634|nr:uncharacterized protein LOC108164466 isoform X1 [Drosophila miranda]